MGVLVFIVAIGACVAHYFPEYYSLQHTNKPGRPAAAAIIDRDTKPTDVIMVYGLDWSPAFPYQAGRRAVMAFKARGELPLDRDIANFGASHVSALVLAVTDGPTRQRCWRSGMASDSLLLVPSRRMTARSTSDRPG